MAFHHGPYRAGTQCWAWTSRCLIPTNMHLTHALQLILCKIWHANIIKTLHVSVKCRREWYVTMNINKLSIHLSMGGGRIALMVCAFSNIFKWKCKYGSSLDHFFLSSSACVSTALIKMTLSYFLNLAVLLSAKGIFMTMTAKGGQKQIIMAVDSSGTCTKKRTFSLHSHTQKLLQILVRGFDITY